MSRIPMDQKDFKPTTFTTQIHWPGLQDLSKDYKAVKKPQIGCAATLNKLYIDMEKHSGMVQRVPMDQKDFKANTHLLQITDLDYKTLSKRLQKAVKKPQIGLPAPS